MIKPTPNLRRIKSLQNQVRRLEDEVASRDETIAELRAMLDRNPRPSPQAKKRRARKRPGKKTVEPRRDTSEFAV